MKKQYIFLLLIFIILYLLYLIINYKYTEFIVNSHIEDIRITNEITRVQINHNRNLLEHINTRAYKNKILKREQGYKNIGENVITLTRQSSQNRGNNSIQIIQSDSRNNPYEGMSNIEKWIYFLFEQKKANL